MLVGERLQLAHVRVELRVGDLGFVVAVVALAVVTDLRGELGGGAPRPRAGLLRFRLLRLRTGGPSPAI
jgi:hypothetical protein